jgi:hypothetical protein
VVGVFELDGWDVAEGFVQAVVVKPGDPLDDGELELAAGAPHAIANQLGLERVDERFSQRVDAPMVVK